VSVTPILTRALKYGAIVSVVVALAGGVIGYAVSGTAGVIGALLGAGLSAVFLGLTTVSMLVGGRIAKDGTDPAFFAVVLGTLGVKFLLFLVFVIWLRGQTWLDPAVFGVTAIVAVIGSLIGDVVAFLRTRVPYVSDVKLPGE
jgi:hypothetical protein